VSEVLRMHRSTVLRHIKTGEIKAVKLGRQYRISANTIKQLELGL
jgi:excisionase family DNA binding protein